MPRSAIHSSLVVLALVAAGAGRAAATEFHASPTGLPAGDGTAAAPWDIVTAFDGPADVQPGDTIWLHGGVYAVTGGLTGRLEGTAEAPIVVRALPGTRVTLDTGASGDNRVFFEGAYTWYWGFEIMSSATDRWADDGSNADRGYGLDLGNGPDTPGLKAINLVIHDTLGGIGFWRGALDGEIYGCLIYYVGYDYDDRGHGHAIYAQNQTGAKRLIDNILFGQYSHGIHVYGSDAAFLDNFHVEGNISFDNGLISTVSGATRNILVGGGNVAQSPEIIDNVVYFTPSLAAGSSLCLDYEQGTANAIVRGNYAVSGAKAFGIAGPGAVVEGNTFYGTVEGADPSTFPDNVYHGSTRPTGVHVLVRPNRYEPGRAHIAVLNWDGLATVDADVSAVLTPGDSYEVRDAQNYFGPPVASGTFDGSPLALPMNGSEAAPVVGTPATPFVHTSSEFGAFVLLRTSGGGADADADADGDAEGDAAGDSADADGDGGDGCGCTLPGAAPPQAAPLLFLAALLAVRRRRP